jgi:hypothetical protein
MTSLFGNTFTVVDDGNLVSTGIATDLGNAFGAGDTFTFTVDGLDLSAQWNIGAPPVGDDGSTDPNAIIITHHIDPSGNFVPTGYFTFDPVLNGFNFSDGKGGDSAPLSLHGPAAIHLIGGSATDRAAAELSLAELYGASATAKQLIDTLVAKGTALDLIVANLAGGGPQDGFAWQSTKYIDWDPFVGVTGTNSDGSTYTESPMMLLAHELVHAAYFPDMAYEGESSEPLVMSISNQIATEVNSSLGTHYDPTRETHETGPNGGQFWTTSPTSTTPSIVRGPSHG